MEILSPAGPAGYLSIVLHAHLPYVRHPEHEHHIEERWLYEAMTETYIPLLEMFGNLLNDNIDFRVTLSLTPTLLEMFGDDLLMERYERYLDSLIALAEEEMFRTRGDSRFWLLAQMYHKRFLKVRHLFHDTYRKDLTSEFISLSRSDKVVIIGSAATHAYLPLLSNEPSAVRAQLTLGAQYSQRLFNKSPLGFWLPECGYYEGLDALLKEAGIDYFFMESHGVLQGSPSPAYSIYAPVRTPSGAAAFARDAEASKQVWSSVEGYPGDFDYRDFYRDIGFDLDLNYLRPHFGGNERTFTGLKYYRVTGPTGGKQPYVRRKAVEKAQTHARHFLEGRELQALKLHNKFQTRPLITAAYDAELFGHWWFEGPEWLDFLFRSGACSKTLRFISPPEYLSEHNNPETIRPAASSWGNRGYSGTWIDTSNEWMYRHLNRAAALMTKAAAENFHCNGLREKALNQAARELLLAQASDWAFMIKTGNASEFARERFLGHIDNFFRLHAEATTGGIDSLKLSTLEQKDNIFRAIDFRIFSERKQG